MPCVKVSSFPIPPIPAAFWPTVPLHLFDSPLFHPLFSICFAILYFAKEKPLLWGRPASGCGVNLVGVICYTFTSLDDQILHRISHEQRCKYIVTGAGLDQTYVVKVAADGNHRFTRSRMSVLQSNVQTKPSLKES